MVVIPNLVLLLKAAKGDSNDPYEMLLNDHEFATVCVQVLDFNFLDVSKIASSLQSPNDYSSIIFTSPRGVEAVKRTLAVSSFNQEWNASLQRAWSKKDCFVVGKATASAAQKLGFTTKGEESGNADNLVSIILKDVLNDHRPILFLCGNLKKETIPNALSEKCVPLTSITVYETSAHSDIKVNLQRLLQNQGIPQYIVFYSPSGANNTCSVLKDLAFPVLDIKHIAIGPTTEDALKKKLLPVAGTCDKPTPESLVETLIKLRDGL